METGFIGVRRSTELYPENVLSLGERRWPGQGPSVGSTWPCPSCKPVPHRNVSQEPQWLPSSPPAPLWGHLLLTWPLHPSQKRVRGDLPEATWPDSDREGRDPGPAADKGPRGCQPPCAEGLEEVELRLCFYWPRPMAQPPRTKTCSLEARGFRKPEPGPLAGSPSGSRGDGKT